MGIRLELTEPGRKLLRQVELQERALSGVLDEVRGHASAVRGRVTVGLPPGYPAVSLSPSLASLLADHPALELRLRFLPHAELARALGSGQLDAALSLQPLRRWDRRLRSVQVREENLILAIPPAYRRLSSVHVARSVAATEIPIVDYYQKPMLIDGWLKHHRIARLKPRVRVFASYLDHVLQLVLEGVGCAVVPRHVVEGELASGRLLEHALDRRRPWSVGVWLNSAQSDARTSASARVVRDKMLG